VAHRRPGRRHPARLLGRKPVDLAAHRPRGPPRRHRAHHP